MKREDAFPIRFLVLVIALAGAPQAGVMNLANAAAPAEGTKTPGFQIRVRFGPELGTSPVDGLEGPWRKIKRPGMRNYLGQISTTLEDVNRLELVLGTRSRSGQQWDIWEAVFSPVGADGYPKRIWDKRTGVIDPAVAGYWREHYDLHHILERDWPTIGKSREGKIHLYVGDMDNYYLNNAVYLMEEFLEKTKEPYYFYCHS